MRNSRALIVGLLAAVTLAACGGGTTGTGGGASPSGPVFNFSTTPVKLPFGGDVCQSLTAGDFSSLSVSGGWSLTDTTVTGGLGGANTACLYNLKSADGGGSHPGVAYQDVSSWDGDKLIESKDSSFQAVPGLGDDAFLFNAFGQNVLYVKAKGYEIVISGVDPYNDLPTLKTLAGDILGRI